MYKNRGPNGRNNIRGKKVAELRKAIKPKVSQRALASLLQLQNIDVDKNAIQKIESGQRFVTDIELLALAKVFGVTTDDLLSTKDT